MFRIVVSFIALALLAPMFLSDHSGAQGAEPDGALVVTDPAGDVFPIGLAPADNPSKRMTDHIDIVRFQVGPDTHGTLPFALTFAGHDETFTTASKAAAFQDSMCYVDMRFKDQPDVRFSLYLYTTDIAPGQDPSWTSSLSYHHRGGDSRNSDYTTAGVTLTWDAASATLRFDIDKAFLPVFPGPHPAGKGDTLEIGWLACYTDTALYVNHSDYIQQEMVYRLRSGGASGTVTMAIAGGSGATETDPEAWSFPSGGEDRVTTTVAPARQSIVPVRLENQAEEKKLVILKAEAVSSAGEWNLSIADSVFLKAKEVRTVNLIVTPPAGAAVGDAVDVRILGELAATAERVELFRSLVVAPVLGEENPTIHFHSRPEPGQDGTAALDDVRGARQQLMVSLLEEEAGWPSGPLETTALRSQWLSDRLPATTDPVRILSEPTATLKVTVTGEEGNTLGLELYVGVDELGEFYHTYTALEPGTHTISLPALVDEDLELPAGTRLGVYLGIYTRSATKMGIDLKETSLTLPVRTEAVGLSLTDGRFLPNLALAEGEDRVTYVNPGKEYAFDLVLSNDGVAEDDLRVTAVLENGTDWSVQVLPGAQFRVEPGVSTPVTVSVVAGEGVPEQETAVIKVKALSKKDPNAHASITLKATATSGVEIEEKRYSEKEDQLAPLADEEEGAPAPLALLAILAALGLIRRRRT